MKLFFIGILIGIGKILPGISGSMLAIRCGIYERVVSSLSSFPKMKRQDILFLSILGTGFLLAMMLGSKFLLFLFLRYQNFLKWLFFFFLVTAIPSFIRKSNSFFLALLTFLIGSIFFFLPTLEGNHFTFFTYLFMGMIEAFSTIIPGVSGTAIYLSLGWYSEMLNLFSSLYLFPFGKIIPFFLGFSICAFFLLKAIAFFLEKYPKETYSAILGFFLSSLFFLF